VYRALPTVARKREAGWRVKKIRREGSEYTSVHPFFARTVFQQKDGAVVDSPRCRDGVKPRIDASLRCAPRVHSRISSYHCADRVVYIRARLRSRHVPTSPWRKPCSRITPKTRSGANARAIVRNVAAREQSLTRWLSNSRPWPNTHVRSTMAKCRVVLALWSSGVGAA